MLCPVEASFPKSAPIRFGKVSKSHFCGMRKSSIMTLKQTQHIHWAMNAASSSAFLWPLFIYSVKNALVTSISNCCAFRICHSMAPEMKIPFFLSQWVGNLLVSVSWCFEVVPYSPDTSEKLFQWLQSLHIEMLFAILSCTWRTQK